MTNISKQEQRAEDQARIERFAEMKSQQTDVQELRALATEVKRMRKELTESEDMLHAELARRACVEGFSETAQEFGFTAKMLRQFAKKYIPTVPDLSSVPTKEMPRERKRVEREERFANEMASWNESVEERKARLERVAEQLGTNTDSETE